MVSNKVTNNVGRNQQSSLLQYGGEIFIIIICFAIV